MVLLASGEALADGEWGVAIGAGPAVHRVTTALAGERFTLGAGARLDVGYRVVDSVAVGVHLGIAYVQGVKYENYIASRTTYVLAEAGVGAQFVIADRLLVAPWIGFLDTVDSRFNAAGIELGFDILVRGHERLSAVATFGRATRYGWGFRDGGGTSDISIGAGVAYRWW